VRVVRALGACGQPLADAARVKLVPAQEEERFVIEVMTSDRALEASREGSKCTPSVPEVSDGECFVVQGYLAHKKTPNLLGDPHRTPGIGLR
jgi:hypothetical protein